MQAIDVIVIAIIAAVVTWYIYFMKSNKIKKIKKRYMELVNLNPANAEKSLERQLSNYRKKHPKKPEEWYLQQIIADLENNRR